MTIHKSKGLEFPILIYAYADIDIYKEKDAKEWYPVNNKDFNGFDSLLLNFNKVMSRTLYLIFIKQKVYNI